MTDDEKIQSFVDMVKATEKLARPWRIALLLTNVLWALVFTIFILMAYLTPETTYQYQEVDGQPQVQSTGSEVVTEAADSSETGPSS